MEQRLPPQSALGRYARAAAERGQSGEGRHSQGLAAGFSALILPGLTIGLGVDYRTTDVKLLDAAEWGDLHPTQPGFNARYELGDYSAGNYDLRQFGARTEAGCSFQLGGTRIVPSLGFDHLVLKNDGFVERGGFALFAPGHTARRTRGFLGLEIGHGWASPIGAFILSAYAHLVNVFSGQERQRSVSFVAAPGFGLAVRGLDESKSSSDLGAKAAFRMIAGAELSACYDGRFRHGFTAHAGSTGLRPVF